MASIRKYRQPRGYFRGGAVPDEGAAPEPAEAAPVEAAPEPVPAPEPEESPFQHALEAQRRAEELARQRQRYPSIRNQIAEIRESDPFRHSVAKFHHGQALADGVPDDSPEMTARILAGIQSEMAYLQEQAADNVHDRGAAILPPERVARASPEALPAPLMPPRRRTVPLSAPPSRDVPTASGGRASDRRIKLSVDEIDMAHRSFTADNMSNAEKEFLYAKNKARMLRMKANGEID